MTPRPYDLPGLKRLDRQMDPAAVVLVVAFVVLPIMASGLQPGDFAHPYNCYARHLAQGECGFHLEQNSGMTYSLHTRCQVDAGTAVRLARRPGFLRVSVEGYHELTIFAMPLADVHEHIRDEFKPVYELIP